MREGALYQLAGFDVTRSNHNFKLAESPVSIRFNDKTRFTEITVTLSPIPDEMFQFRSYDQLLLLANTNIELPGLVSTIFPTMSSWYCCEIICFPYPKTDVVGEIRGIRTVLNDETQTCERIMLNLRINRCVALNFVLLGLKLQVTTSVSFCIILTVFEYYHVVIQFVCVSVFDKLATHLDEKLFTLGVQPKVIIASNINPKLVGGNHFTV